MIKTDQILEIGDYYTFVMASANRYKVVKLVDDKEQFLTVYSEKDENYVKLVKDHISEIIVENDGK